MSYPEKDKSVSSGEPVEFYEFVSSMGTFRYTTDSEIAFCGGEEYLPLEGGIFMGPVETSSVTDGLSTVDFRFPIDSEIAQAFCLKETPPDLLVTARRAHRGDDWSIDFSVEWTGEGTTTSVSDFWATLRTASVLQTRLRGHTAAILYQRSCNHRVYDARCGVNRSDWTIQTTVTEIQGSQITVENQGAINGELAIGEVTNLRTGEVRSIRDNQNNLISMSYPFLDVQVGDLLEMVFGCNRLRLGHCRHRFNNEARYGGFDFIPENNPFENIQPKELTTTTASQSWRPPAPVDTPPVAARPYVPPVGSGGTGGGGTVQTNPFETPSHAKEVSQPPATPPTLRNTVSSTEKASSIRGSIPTAKVGVSVPFLLGRRRVASPNVIWVGQPKVLYSTYVSTEVVNVGNNVTENRTTRTRTPTGMQIDLQFGICLGPNVRLRAIYAADLPDPIWEGNVGPARTEFTIPSSPTPTNYSGKQVAFVGGAFDQEPDPWLSVTDYMPPATQLFTFRVMQAYRGLGGINFFYGFARNVASLPAPAYEAYNRDIRLTYQSYGFGPVPPSYTSGWDFSAIYMVVEPNTEGYGYTFAHIVGNHHLSMPSITLNFTWKTQVGPPYDHSRSMTLVSQGYDPVLNATVYRALSSGALLPGWGSEEPAGAYGILMNVTQERDTRTVSDMPSYVGIAYAIIKDVRADNGIMPIQFEVERFPNPLGFTTLRNRYRDDLNPASAIIDVLTNDWGGASLAIDYVNRASFTAAAAQFQNERNYCSLLITGDTPSGNIVKTIQAQTYSLIYQSPSSGQLEINPIRATELDLEAATRFNDTNIIRLQSLDKGDWLSAWTMARGVFVDRSNNYEPSTLLINTTTQNTTDWFKRQSGEIQYPYVMYSDLALDLLTRDMALSITPRFTCSLEVNRDGASLAPGDVCLVSWPKFNFWGVPMVVSKVKKAPLTENTVLLGLEQYANPDMTVLESSPAGSSSGSIDLGSVPPPLSSFLTAPFWLARESGLITSDNLSPLVFPVVLPVAANTVQATFRALIDNIPGVGRSTMINTGYYPVSGELNSPISRLDGYENGLLPSIILRGLSADAGFENMASARQRDGSALLFINNEILTFETAAYIGAEQWQLGNVRRALIDTVAQDHAAGSLVFFAINAFSCVGNTSFNHPLSFSPSWRLVSNSVNQVGRDDNATLATGWSPTNLRTMAPPRPHDTRIEGLRPLDPPTIPIGALVNVSWKTRTRGVSQLQFQTDVAEQAEVLGGNRQFHRVYLRDSAGLLSLLGTTPMDDTYNALTVTMPSNAAAGIGTLFVRSVNQLSESVFDDGIRVNIWRGSDIQFRYGLDPD